MRLIYGNDTQDAVDAMLDEAEHRLLRGKAKAAPRGIVLNKDERHALYSTGQVEKNVGAGKGEPRGWYRSYPIYAEEDQ